ncbi:unnamed protein product [Arctogadus glacialis]
MEGWWAFFIPTIWFKGASGGLFLFSLSPPSSTFLHQGLSLHLPPSGPQPPPPSPLSSSLSTFHHQALSLQLPPSRPFSRILTLPHPPSSPILPLPSVQAISLPPPSFPFPSAPSPPSSIRPSASTFLRQALSLLLPLPFPLPSPPSSVRPSTSSFLRQALSLLLPLPLPPPSPAALGSRSQAADGLTHGPICFQADRERH